MIHIRINPEADNREAKYKCGLTYPLPEGDVCYYAGERLEIFADCQGCNPGGPHQLGIPISQLSGRADPGNPAWERWKAYAAACGYD